jgi:hypothetical protein
MMGTFKFIVGVVLLLFSEKLWAQDSTMNALTLGPVTFGEDRVPIHLSQVKVETDIPDLIHESKFVEKSVQWIRMDSVLLVPRARFQLMLKLSPDDVLLQYQGKSFVTQDKNGLAYAEFFVPLFFPGTIDVIVKGEHQGSIGFTVSPKGKAKKQVIDYSCSSHDLQIIGLENDYFSAGCFVSRHGTFGEEKGTLEIRWAAPNYRLIDDSEPPYVLTMQPNMPARFAVKNRFGQEKVVEIRATIPERLPRIKTALGLGPYVLSSREGQDETPGLLAPSIMLYGKFDLTETNSIRFFEAYFQQETLFNNFGFYYAYDVGAAFDRRILMSLNLGFQGVEFRHKSKGKLDNMIIFPQGIELTYRHAFGMQNYNLVYGMFLPTSMQEDYRNVWLRFGKRTFGEWNYLSWRRKNRFVQAWGISVGFPFVTLY